VPADVASVIADSCGGSPGRAQVMIDDPEVSARAALWASVPDRLDGNGAAASDLVLRLIESTDHATEPLRSEHARQLESLTAEAKEMGERSLAGRKEIVDQQQREERRWRTDALRAGLGVLARAYRGRAVGDGGRTVGDTEASGALAAVALITEAAQALPRNPNEALLLQSLLVRLGALAA
jgi:hypothetical protein